MSRKRTVVTYAHGLLSTALQDWIESLQEVQRKLQRDPALLPALDDPSLSVSAKETQLEQLVPRDVPQEAHNFLRLLVRQGHMNLLEDILVELQSILQEAGKAVQVARVTTAVPLSAEERTKLEERFTREYGDNLVFEYEEDPSILGGVRVRIGDRVIDGTVSGRLSALRERLVG